MQGYSISSANATQEMTGSECVKFKSKPVAPIAGPIDTDSQLLDVKHTKYCMSEVGCIG